MRAGFLDEVRALRGRPGLAAAAPSLRAVGYRQLWAHLEGGCDRETAIARAVAATRQLARRQLIWIRSDGGWQELDPGRPGAQDGWCRAVLQAAGRA